MNRKLFVFLMAVLTVIIGLAIVPAMNAQEGNSIDVTRHCKHHGRVSAHPTTNHPESWVCVDSGGNTHPISMDNACAEQYGSGASSRYSDSGNPFSWYCQLPDSPPNNDGGDDASGNPQPQPTSPPPLHFGVRREGLNLNDYCRDKGLGVAELVGDRWAGDWKCNLNGVLYDMNIEEACRMQHGLPYAGLDNGQDPNGWYCSDQEVYRATPWVTRSLPSLQPTDVPDPGPAFGNQDRGRSNGQCEIGEFSLSPAGLYVLDQEVAVRLRSNCSTVRFSVNGSVRDELGAPDHSYTFRTASRGVGSFEICGEGRRSSSWDNAARQCVRVYVGPEWRVDEYVEPSSNEDENHSQCNSASNLYREAIAVVSDADPAPLNVRSGPSTSEEIKFTVPVRGFVTIIGGPSCNGNMVWWEIGYHVNGDRGWAAEINAYNNRNLLLNGEPLPGGSDGGQDNPVVPVPTNPPPQPPASNDCPSLGSRLSQSQTGRSIIDGRGYTTIRSSPGGANIGQLQEGETFRVLSNEKRCQRASSGNLNLWIQVRSENSVEGWIPEVWDNSYTVEPWVVNTDQNPQATLPPLTVTQLSVPVAHHLWGQTYTLVLDTSSCLVTNGSEIVVRELANFTQWMSEVDARDEATTRILSYMMPQVGFVEIFRINAVGAVSAAGCSEFRYKVGERTMDASGLGNIVYGYALGSFPSYVEAAIARGEQAGRDLSLRPLIEGDNPDDLTQRNVGRRIWEVLQFSVPGNSQTVERISAQEMLR